MDGGRALLHRGTTAEIRLVPYAGREAIEKRLLPHALDKAEARDDLLREGRILESLAGRGAPALLARGDDSRGPFFVLERGPSETLASVDGDELHRSFARLARTAFVTLASIHAADDDAGPLAIVHADISPPNVLVTPQRDGCLFVDFQLATYRDGGPPSDGAFRGTLDTVAPEVARGERATSASDVFSLAASLVSSALKRPLRAVELPEALRIVRAAEEPINGSVDALTFVDERTRDVMRACLAHDPSERISTAAEVVVKLGIPPA